MTSSSRNRLVLPGRPIAPGLACGPLRRNRPDLRTEEASGSILVAERAVPDDVPRLIAARGVLTLSGSPLSHVALLSREFGKPSVALSGRTAARLSDGPGAALLLLDDVVGGERPPVLHEGDVVFVDGDRGVVEIPGAGDPEAMERLRRAHETLVAFGARPGDRARLAAVVAVAGGEPIPLRFLLEAATLYRIVPPGDPVARLVDALAAGSAGPLVDDERRRIRERIERRAEARAEAAVESIRSTEDLDEMQRSVRRLETGLDLDAALLRDLGGDPARARGGLPAVREEADARRTILRAGIEEELADAAALPPAILAARVGGLHRLLRRARSSGLSGDAVACLQSALAAHLADERERAGTHLVLPLDDAMPRDRTLVGGKAAGLAEVRHLVPEDCRIPRGFVVTSAAYRMHTLGEVGVGLSRAMEAGADAAVSRKARAAILAAPMPAEVAEAIAEAFPPFAGTPLAVRSSATAEDGPIGSFAGVFDSYLGVAGLEALRDRIRRAWASQWNARALAVLAASGLSPLRIGQAVLVQELVEVRAAGVLFSRDPSGRPDTLLIHAAWGLGEGISQGDVPGDMYWVRRSTGEILASEHGPATHRIVAARDGSGTVEVPLSEGDRGRPCLDAPQIRRLAGLARSLEEGTGRAQDVEFGFTPAGDLTLFQVRRIVGRR